MDSLTENRDVPGPVVYGYLRVVGSLASQRQSALQAALLRYCQQHELTLSGTFTEREHSGSSTHSAFTELLDVLLLPGTYGAVVPAPAHLGPRHVAAERHRQITAMGRRLLVIRPIAGRRSAASATTADLPPPLSLGDPVMPQATSPPTRNAALNRAVDHAHPATPAGANQ
ncbi:hypothetical protein P3T35_005314 [Kitasatospora sp. GP30]|nr:hypothetical protein [Kitasatospora sp. GP30]